jgi:hypothetical protein
VGSARGEAVAVRVIVTSRKHEAVGLSHVTRSAGAREVVVEVGAVVGLEERPGGEGNFSDEDPCIRGMASRLHAGRNPVVTVNSGSW